jgi:tetratricopeptide (TPR) repeat protein
MSAEMKTQEPIQATAEDYARAARQLAEDPTNAELWQKLGRVCFKLGRRQEAKEALEQSRTLDELDPFKRVYLANFYLAEGEFEAALKEALRAQELLPSQAWGYILAAQAYARMRRFTKAEHEFEKGLLAAPYDRTLERKWSSFRRWRELRKWSKFKKQSTNQDARGGEDWTETRELL